MRECLRSTRKHSEFRGRNIRLFHQLLGERFRALDLCSVFGRPPYAQSARPEYINYPAYQWIVRSDYGEADFFLFYKIRKLLEFHYIYWHIFGKRSRAAIPRRYIEPSDAGRLLQFPCERMLPPAAANYQNIHRR